MSGLAIRQRVVTGYRAQLFARLAERLGGLHLIGGQARPGEGIALADAVPGVAWRRTRNVYRLSGPLATFRQPELRSWLEQADPDLLVMEANPRAVDTGIALRWMRARGRRVFGWGLGTPSLTVGLEAPRAWLRRRFVRRFDGMIAYSTTAAAQYVDAGHDPARVFVAHNSAIARPTWPLPDRPPVPEGPPRLLFVGRLVPQKRVDRLLAASEILSSRGVGHELWIVGDGPARSGLEARAGALEARVRFLGYRSGAALGEVCRQADLFVLPGRGGLAMQETMAYGLPLIVAEADGTEADLVTPENGWVVGDGDPARLADRIAGALADPVRLRRMGAASYGIIRDRVNLDRMVDVFESVLRRFGRPSASPGRRAS